jgi:hypothetical protein
MNSIQKEQILRVNCPGFGEENYFTVGKARALDAYKVIIVNPVSIFHIFDKDLELQKDIDTKLAEGLTSSTIASDQPLQTILDDLKTKRILELVSFLEKGGLLIYYLCRPFLVQGDNLAVDNYAWLESLAPDSSPDDNIRHMSAVSHGRVVETTEQGEASEFAAYFGQPGLEWNTIIRQDFLTEGYMTLATAGPRKCISAQLIAGDQGGRILFLPSPYSPDFDKKLIECVQIWYDKYNPGSTSSGSSGQTSAATQPEAASNIQHLLKDESSQASVAAQAQGAQPPSHIPMAVNATPAPKVAAPEPIKFAQPATATAPAAAAGTERRPMTKSLFDSHSSIPAAQPATASGTASGASQAGSDDSNGKTVSSSSLLDSIATPQAPAQSEPKTSLASILGAAAPTAAQAQLTPAPPPPPVQPPVPPPPREEPPSKPNANDLLRELESLSEAQTKAAAPPPPPSPVPARDLVSELETLAHTVRSDKPVVAEAAAPAEPSAAPATAGKGLGTMFSGMKKKSMFGDDEEEQEPLPAPPAPPAMATPPPPPTPPVQAVPQPPAAVSAAVGAGLLSAASAGLKTEIDNHKDQLNQVPQVPEAKDLIKKMEEISKTPTPDWCAAVPFPVVDELRRKRNALTEAIQQAQAEISQLDAKINQLENLKVALLGAEGDELMAACMRVFMKLGWTPKISEKDKEELSLSGGDKPQVIARIVRSASQAKRADIAQLAESVITFWGEHEIEPKGLLVACTWANRPMSERVEPDYTDGLSEFAQKKNLCLMTTTQLLAIFRDLEMGKSASDDICRRILDTSGRLAGYQLDNSMAAV